MRCRRSTPIIPPILLVHGDADTMIPADALFAAAAALGRAGAAVQWHLSRGVGHSIDPEALLLAATFLVHGLARIIAAHDQRGELPDWLILSQIGHNESAKVPGGGLIGIVRALP